MTDISLPDNLFTVIMPDFVSVADTTGIRELNKEHRELVESVFIKLNGFVYDEIKNRIEGTKNDLPHVAQ